MFTTESDLPLLQQRALAARISMSMREKGLRAGDLFMLFDHDGDGSLTPAELYGGIDWLGIKISPKQIQVGMPLIGSRVSGPGWIQVVCRGLGAWHQSMSHTGW